MTLPYPRLPWVERGDYEIEVDWGLSNLDDVPVVVDVTVNGFNEFHEYVPEAVVQVNDEDQLAIFFAQWERKIRIPAMERMSGTIREEAFDEAAVDLAIIGNGAPNPNQVVHPDNHSDTDARSQAFIPPVIPALTGFRVGLRTDGAVNLIMELTVRVRDEAGRIVSSDRAWVLPVPMQISPAAAMTMP